MWSGQSSRYSFDTFKEGTNLGGENVARTPLNLGAKSGQSLNEHGSLNSHVQAASNTSTLIGRLGRGGGKGNEDKR